MNLKAIFSTTQSGGFLSTFVDFGIVFYNLANPVELSELAADLTVLN
jgi:hypothetical protein